MIRVIKLERGTLDTWLDYSVTTYDNFTQARDDARFAGYCLNAPVHMLEEDILIDATYISTFAPKKVESWRNSTAQGDWDDKNRK